MLTPPALPTLGRRCIDLYIGIRQAHVLDHASPASLAKETSKIYSYGCAYVYIEIADFIASSL